MPVGKKDENKTNPQTQAPLATQGTLELITLCFDVLHDEHFGPDDNTIQPLSGTLSVSIRPGFQGRRQLGCDHGNKLNNN